MPDITQTLTLPDDTEVAIVLNPDLPGHENLGAIFGADQVKAAIEAAAQNAYPSLHWRHGNDVIESKTAGKVVDAFLKTGEVSDAEDVICNWMDEGAYYQSLATESFDTSDVDDGWGRFIATAESAVRNSWCKVGDIREAFDEAVQEALINADDSTPFDQMKHALNIGVVYVAGEETGLDDLAIQSAIGQCVHSSDVRADKAMENFLRFVNISSADYRAAVLAEHDVDLHALEDKYAQASAEWRAFNIDADPARPALITPQQAVELLDNASYGGVPVCYAYLEPKAFLDLPWDTESGKNATVELRGAGKGMPAIAIHNFSNGSGHLIRTEAAVRLPLDYRNWHVDDVRYRYGIDSVYGLSLGAFKVRPDVVDYAPIQEAAPVEGPSP